MRRAWQIIRGIVRAVYGVTVAPVRRKVACVSARARALFEVVVGAFMIAVSVMLAILGVQVHNHSSLAQQACERSKQFGPYLARDYEERDVFPANVQRQYRATIPHDCD